MNTGDSERARLGAIDRAVVGGGAAIVAHAVLIALLAAFAPGQRPRPEPRRVDFEMAPIPPPPVAPAAVAPAAAAPAPSEPAAIQPAALARPAVSPRATSRQERGVESAVSDVLGDAGAPEGGIAGAGTGLAEEGTSVGPGAMRATGVGAQGDVAPAATRPRPDAEAVRSAVQAKLHYPRAAEEMGVEGRVRVTFTIDESGAVEDVRVLRSAGQELDAAAMAAVKDAAPFASPPGRVIVPVDFVLPTP